MLIGLIADTHGLLRPEARAALRGADLILHAGDIGAADVMDQLRAIAPVIGVRGNNDTQGWAASIPERQIVDVHGRRILVLHAIGDLDRAPAPACCAAVVFGHSHRPLVETRDGVLFVNPGSAGPRRFTLPVTVGHLRIAQGRLRAEIVALIP